jgi:toxin ParE1/3/4
VKKVILRLRAERDVEAVIAHYLDADEAAVARQFVQALQRAYAHLAQFPTSGSPRFGLELGFPGLRTWPVTPFRLLIFYVETADKVDVWAVLHERRDISDLLSESPSF